VELERITGKLTQKSFKFVAGTSVGAIIAAGVAAGIPATELRKRFITAAERVFAPRPWNPLVRLVTGHMYSVTNLNSELRQALGEAADLTLNDLPIDLLVTAVRVTDGKPWYFVKDNPKNSQRTGHLKLVDCVTASAAAPTYFAPWTITEDPATLAGHKPIGALVDGGVSVTSNPIYQACVEAFDYTGDKDGSKRYDPANTIVVSLGTGSYLARDQPRWLGAWLTWLISEMLRSPNEQQTEIVRRHFTQTPCLRINPILHEDIQLDDTKQLPHLLQQGNQLAAEIKWPEILAGDFSSFESDGRFVS
jgi:hypothetical protein